MCDNNSAEKNGKSETESIIPNTSLKMSNEMITLEKLKQRGWTNSLVNLFVPEPDKLARNPFYRCAPPCRLYKLSRILEIEKTESFQSKLRSVQTRKNGALKAVKTKQQKIIEWAEQQEIEIEKLPLEKLKYLAIESWRLHKEMIAERRYDWDALVDLGLFQPSEEMSQRLMVNFLRHECSEYEYKLYEIFGKVGVRKAREIIFKRIMDKIAEIYPELADECRIQSLVRFDDNREVEDTESLAA